MGGFPIITPTLTALTVHGQPGTLRTNTLSQDSSDTLTQARVGGKETKKLSEPTHITMCTCETVRAHDHCHGLVRHDTNTSDFCPCHSVSRLCVLHGSRLGVHVLFFLSRLRGNRGAHARKFKSLRGERVGGSPVMADFGQTDFGQTDFGQS